MANVKEKLVETERPAISEFQNSLLADAEVAKRIANALDTKNTANFVTLIQHCSGVVLTSGIGMDVLGNCVKAISLIIWLS